MRKLKVCLCVCVCGGGGGGGSVFFTVSDILEEFFCCCVFFCFFFDRRVMKYILTVTHWSCWRWREQQIHMYVCLVIVHIWCQQWSWCKCCVFPPETFPPIWSLFVPGWTTQYHRKWLVLTPQTALSSCHSTRLMMIYQLCNSHDFF